MQLLPFIQGIRAFLVFLSPNRKNLRFLIGYNRIRASYE